MKFDFDRTFLVKSFLILILASLAQVAKAIPTGNGAEFIPPSLNLGVGIFSPEHRLAVNGAAFFAEHTAPSLPDLTGAGGVIYVDGSHLYYKSSTASPYQLDAANSTLSNTDFTGPVTFSGAGALSGLIKTTNLRLHPGTPSDVVTVNGSLAVNGNLFVTNIVAQQVVNGTTLIGDTAKINQRLDAPYIVTPLLNGGFKGNGRELTVSAGNMRGILATTNGGTGVSNSTGSLTFNKTVTFGGSPASVTINTSGPAPSNVTLPVTGTLATLTGAETLRNKTVLVSNGTVTVPTYSFNGDTNTGIYEIAQDVLGFTTGGSERIRIDASGKVGVGTGAAALTKEFEVAGTVKAGTFVGAFEGPGTSLTGVLLTANNLSEIASPLNKAAARSNLGLVIGSAGVGNVQAYDTDLDTWATKTAPSGTVVGNIDPQTLSNKTLTAPVLTGLVSSDTYYTKKPTVLTASSTTNINWTTASTQIINVTTDAATGIVFQTPPPSTAVGTITVLVNQTSRLSAVNSATWSATLPATIKWLYGYKPSLSGFAASMGTPVTHLIECTWDSTNYLCQVKAVY